MAVKFYESMQISKSKHFANQNLLMKVFAHQKYLKSQVHIGEKLIMQIMKTFTRTVLTTIYNHMKENFI